MSGKQEMSFCFIWEKGDDMLQCLNQAITKHKIKNGQSYL